MKLKAAKVSVAPSIDGKIDEPIWQELPRATDFIDPFTNKPVEDSTDAWIGYDSKGVYVAFHCHMKRPEDLVAREIRPGTAFQGEDFVALRLDPFNARQDNTNISRYQVNALGTQNDEISGGRAAKREWRGDWKAAAQRVPDGYTVEMAIPWEAMNTPNAKSPQDMTLNFVRVLGKQNMKVLWSNTGPSEKVELNGIWEGVELPKPKAQRPQFLAYGMLEVQKNKVSADAGLDLRYSISSELTAVGSINPDFKNVEQAVDSIAFTRGERFLGDTRPFFAEGKDRFNLTQEFAIGTLFYSRRIKDFDVAGKVYGNLNVKNKIGALATIGRRDEANAVFSVNHSFNKTNFTAFGTVHHDRGLQDNNFGASASKQWGNWWTDGEIVHEDRGGTKAKAFDFGTTYIIPRFLVDIRYSSIDPNYDPVLGLVPFNDQRGPTLYIEYNNDYKSRWLKRIHAESYSTAMDHFDGSIFSRTTFAYLSLLGNNDHQVKLSTEHQLFEGLHDDTYRVGYLVGANNRFLQYGVDYELGKRSDDPYSLVSLKGTFRILGKLDLGVSALFQNFQGTSQQYVGTLSWEIDPVRSIVGRVVKTGSNVNAYLAYRSAGIKGKELYVILGDPNSEKTKARLAVKLVVPF